VEVFEALFAKDLTRELIVRLATFTPEVVAISIRLVLVVRFILRRIVNLKKSA
jgi:hypothetical protein